MSETQLEEARRCPACEQPGSLVNRRAVRSDAVPRGTMLETYECRNSRCPEYVPAELLANGTATREDRNRWFVQVNPDGTIPPKGTGGRGDKAFDPPNIHSEASVRARDQLRLLAAQDEMHSGQAHEIQGDLNYRGSY